ncbi:hypothetical protein LCGC14_1346330 [marine sediment metagenome]|uniref:DUF2190 domain-containing protein n=1 Tax=marine sediment metagenome TaxID=412755 RepID=A0A0F9KYE3_9ZZZZ
MANPAGNNAAAGDLAKTSGVEVISRKVTGAAVVKGNVVHIDTAGLAIKGTSSGTIADGYGVALEAVAANGNGRFAVGNTWVYVIADGAIIPNNLVKIASTAGQVVSNDEPADSTIPSPPVDTDVETDIDAVRDYFGKTVGRYIGHQLEEVGDPTDAANDDVIIIRMGL